MYTRFKETPCSHSPPAPPKHWLLASQSQDSLDSSAPTEELLRPSGAPRTVMRSRTETNESQQLILPSSSRERQRQREAEAAEEEDFLDQSLDDRFDAGEVKGRK